MENQLKAYGKQIDTHLERLLPSVDLAPSALFQAMRYSCLSEGKRLRPAMCLAACEAVGGNPEDALDVACAIEMVHSFSLIHDDLPALDDDDLRRGRPTCHIVYGEAIAILAGDALFNQAFETVALSKLDAAKVVRCVQILTHSIGALGVVAGEAADIIAEGQAPDAQVLEQIHTQKTGALIAGSCELGATIGTDDAAMVRSLRDYGLAVGHAFQIADDLLNETGSEEQIGKSTGSDRVRGKLTYPLVYGVESSRKRAIELVDDAVQHLENLPGEKGFLTDLAVFAIERFR